MSIGDRIEEARDKAPLLDHAIRTVEHYGKSQGRLHAGAVTYFAFLSFFPLLALTVFAVGYVSNVYPAADMQLRDGIEAVVPGLLGTDDGQISLDDVRTFSGLAGLIGLVGVVYTGLGFIQALREALVLTFDREPTTDSFVKVKAFDLLGLVTIGGSLLLSIVLGSAVSQFSTALLGLVGLGDELAPLLTVLGIAVTLVLDALIFYVMFRRLVRSELPAKALWSGAALGAIGFELFKQVAGLLIGLATGNSAAAAAFGTALVLIVVFNYVARLILYAACWAYTAPAARAERGVAVSDQVQGPQNPTMRQLAAAHAAGAPRSRRWMGPFAAGGAAALGLVAVVRKKDRGRG